MQFEFIMTLAHCGNLMVVGDPDQSIYQFRQANGQCFQQLRQRFPELRTLYLKQSFRSTKNILDGANAVLMPEQVGGCGWMWMQVIVLFNSRSFF